MLTPRWDMDNMNRKDLRFIGGTENFDLWWRVEQGETIAPKSSYPLRIQRVAGGSINWDVFRFPLRDNEEVGTNLPPLERGVTGYWRDVTLLWDDVEQVETYLRCFAPWTFEETSDA